MRERCFVLACVRNVLRPLTPNHGAAAWTQLLSFQRKVLYPSNLQSMLGETL